MGALENKNITTPAGKGSFRKARALRIFGGRELPAAIEISASGLKLLQLARRRRGYTLAKCDYQPLPAAAASADSAIKAALEKLAKENNLSGQVCAALGLSKIQASSYPLPQMPPEEAAAAVAWKARQGLPQNLNLTDLSLDYMLIESPAARSGAQEAVALVFMAHKKQVADLLQIFQSCGLELILLEPKPYVLVKVMYALSAIKAEETVLVVDIGEEESSVAIASAGYPYLIRSLLVSGSGLAGPVAASQLEGLAVDLEHTFKYFSHELVKSRVTSFERVVLCGAASRIPGLSRFLFEKLGVAADIFDPAAFLKSLAKRGLNPRAEANLADFGAALGLAAEYSDGKFKAD